MENKQKDNFNIGSTGEDESYYGVGSFIWEVVKVFFWALIIIVPIRVFLFQPFFVQGASMEPNFHDGDYLIINEMGYKRTEVGLSDVKIFTVDTFKTFERGDVAVFKYPKNPDQFFIKRIIALPGEKIEISDGKIAIYNNENPEGFYLEEDKYLSDSILTKGALSKQLSLEEYFVMGDNRDFSHDSRAWGAIKKSDVVGKAFLRAWPFQDAGLF